MNGNVNLVCILSFAPSLGGVAKHQADQISFLCSKKIACQLIDQSASPTTTFLANSSDAYLELLEAPVWTQVKLAAADIYAHWKKKPPSVVVVSNIGLAIKLAKVIAQAKREWGSKLIFISHSRVFHRTPKHFVMEALCAWYLRNYNEIIYVSRFTQNSWLTRYPWLKLIQSRIVHNGVKIPDEIQSPQEQAKRIGFLGRLAYEKDPLLFCQVAKLAEKQGLAYEFHIFGSGPELNNLKQYSSPKLIFHGEYTRIEETLKSIDLLLVTSRIENCPYSILETKSFGIPTVSTAVGGVNEILTHGLDGILVSKRDPQALIDGLKEACSMYVKLRQGCLAERFKFERFEKSAQIWAPYLN